MANDRSTRPDRPTCSCIPGVRTFEALVPVPQVHSKRLGLRRQEFQINDGTSVTLVFQIPFETVPRVDFNGPNPFSEGSKKMSRAP